MISAYDLWKNKENPQWLLLASRSDVTGGSVDAADFEKLNRHIDQIAYGDLPPVDSKLFLKNIAANDREFLGIIQKEGIAYSKAFKDNYNDELFSQAAAAFGSKYVESISDTAIEPGVAGNLIVVVALGAVRDLSLVNDLHRRREISDEEFAYGMKEINDRLDRTGINGVDRLLESRPELERFLEHDKTVIKLSHVKGDYQGKTATRAAYYNNAKLNRHKSPTRTMTKPRENVIASDFPDLERRKDSFIQMHVDVFPPPSEESREKFADKGLMAGRGGALNDIEHAQMLADMIGQINRSMKKEGREEFNSYKNVLLHDGIAINHPQRETYARDLRKRMKDGLSVEVIHPDDSDQNKLDDSYKPPREDIILPESSFSTTSGSMADREKERRRQITHHRRENAEDLGDEPRRRDSSPIGNGQSNNASADSQSSSNTGAKIATIGGGLAVGLLLAAGRGDKSDKDHDNQDKEQKSNVLKYAALAAAAAVTAGGAILWSKRPEFLYKPLESMLGLGKARA